MPRPAISNSPAARLDARLGLLALPVGDLGVNCYLLWDVESRAALIVDPGDEAGRILDAIRARKLKPQWIVNTHGHADHLGANAEVKAATGASLLIHPADAPCLTDPYRNLSTGFGSPVVSPAADGFLAARQVLRLGDLDLRVLETPGHSPGSICLYGEGLLFSGDTLFAQSVGRTDLPGGDYERLAASLRRELLHLPPKTEVYPGHGPATSMGRELATNPFLAEGFFL